MKRIILNAVCVLLWFNAISSITISDIKLLTKDHGWVASQSLFKNTELIEESVFQIGGVINSSKARDLSKPWEGNYIEIIDTIIISSNNRNSNKKVNQYQYYKSILVNQTGFSTEVEFGTDGGGRTMFSLNKYDESDYTIKYQHQFRSQHITVSFRYNLRNIFASMSFTREHIQPQDGKRIEDIPGIGLITYPGLNNFFPKDKNYYGITIGYDIRNSYRLFLTPFAGISLYSYQGSKKLFNDIHKERIAYNLGLKSYFVIQNDLLFFIQGYYSKQCFKQVPTLIKDPRTYDLVTFIDKSVSHDQIFISFGFQFKLSNRFN